MPDSMLGIGDINLDIKNPKKNFKTTFHNSRDSRKEVRRHLFVVSVPIEVEQRIQKI